MSERQESSGSGVSEEAGKQKSGVEGGKQSQETLQGEERETDRDPWKY